MRRIARAVMAAVVGTAAITGGLQAPAYADSTCYQVWVCMWEDNNYGGDKWVEFHASAPANREIGGWNGDNEISSVKNRSSYYVCIYADDGQHGDWIRLAPGAYVPNLEDSHDFDNDAESFKVTSGNC